MSTRRTVLKGLGAGALVTTGLTLTGGSSAQAAPTGDEILLDSYAGTDDQKLTAALAAAKASSPRLPIRLAARSHTFSQTRTTFSGLRILGPNTGWQNPEISGTSGALPQCTVTLNCGNGASSWLVGTATTYDITVSGICFKSSNGVTQFYHHPYSAGTSYATRLDTLTFLGFKHVLGTPADPFAATLNTWAGDWTLVGVQDTQFSLRGSDNWFGPSSMNYGWAGANGGKYLMRFSNVSKTSVRNLYLTARGGSRAILVEGPASQQGGLDFSDCVIEGQNANDPAMGALIVVKGGGASFTNTKLNFGMARPSDFTDQSDTGLIMVQGGTAVFTNTWTNRATATAESVPVVAVSGGQAYVSTVLGMGGNWSSKPKAVRTGGALVTDATVTAA
ncbi:hypothetical protein [Phycicoccus sp. Root101]|uniref:hypothetical protein n=1 Tax=Phycicoccus sp. Root101 TaxID=1736421 RepID=UPI0007030015|nr:hypothetical protein [Phycicoccus sp. Root101]KQU65448.1 hypothetical protein ASC58_18440 [Phycicoccus sp. Root101]